MRTRPLLAGLVLPLSAALITSAHAHTGAGVAIVGPVTYQSQLSPSPGLSLSEIFFLFALFLLGIHLLPKLRQRPLIHFRTRLIGVSMIAILGLGVVAYTTPSHEVSVNPPVSFTFYFGGDTGYYSGSLVPSNSSNRLIQPDFFLDLGDISYNGTSRGNPPTGNEADWCNFIKANVQNRIGNPNFPYVFVTGNHEDGNPSTLQRDGYIDSFIANNCMPLSAFNSTATAGNGYINFVGSGLCSESTTCYGKEGYFDYPAANPIARIITITVADSVGNSTIPSANVNFNYCPLSVCGMPNLDMHWNWLTGVIADAKAAGRWIIVAFHKPCLSPDLTTGCEGNGMPNGHNPNYQLESYLMSHGVDVLLNGHVHVYARSKQLTCLGPSEPLSGSTVGITYDPTCVANDGSSGVYTRGKGTVEVIQGVFSQRDEQLNFSRPDINYFAKAMSARGSLTITPADCCWANGSPVDMASGNGVGMMTINATHASFTWMPSLLSHNTQNLIKFSDSFVIGPQSNPVEPPRVTVDNPTPNVASTGQEITTTFTASSSVPVSGITVSWGDGTPPDNLPGAATSDTHIYASTGNASSRTFTIYVTATNSAGPGSGYSFETVSDRPPIITATSVSPSPAKTGATIMINFSATDPDGTLNSISVDWGDGTTPDSMAGTATSDTHAYASAASFTITLTALDNSGSKSRATLSITVQTPTSKTSLWDDSSLVLEASVAAAILAITVLTVLLVRRRSKTIANQGPYPSQTKMLRRDSLPRFETGYLGRLVCYGSLRLQRQVEQAYALSHTRAF